MLEMKKEAKKMDDEAFESEEEKPAIRKKINRSDDAEFIKHLA